MSANPERTDSAFGAPGVAGARIAAACAAVVTLASFAGPVRAEDARVATPSPEGAPVAPPPGGAQQAAAPEPSAVPPRLPPPDAPPPAAAARVKATSFAIDPVVDGVLIAGATTFALFLSRVVATGEIGNRPVGSSDNLLSIDKVAVTQTLDPHAAARSNVGIAAAVGYAILDPILSGVRDGRGALLVDAILYAEALATSQAVAQATKVTVRRPRPIDHIECSGEMVSATDCADPDLQLSFYSAHASTMSAVTGVATYLAFVRSPPSSPRPWITLAAGTAMTAFVGYERVRSGEHFPSDVIVGAVVGGGIGVLVAHLHRWPRVLEGAPVLAQGPPPVVVGYTPIAHGVGALSLQLRF